MADENRFVRTVIVQQDNSGKYAEVNTTISAIDASGNKPAAFGNLLSTIAADASRKGQWFSQNQSVSDLLLVLDDGSDNAVTVLVMTAASANGRAGGVLSANNYGLHFGRIRVYGLAGAQFALRAQ